ncbi:urotensin 1 isoform X1 [Amphiprion ocellaris]|uniref:urotensin 1 isoform X1 n=1 Tax=Amphiprion ocellaris TaxID=80972 RepID=UPI000C30B382|nr:urotensin 1 isoform X1 [Amphiprion ocellaris]
MKSAPLLLLLSSVLLSSHLRPAVGRPRTFPGWLDGSGRLQQTQQMDEMLLRAAAAGDGSASDLLGNNILRFLQRRSPDRLHLLPPEEEEESDDGGMRIAAQLLKRSEEPPLSIDLTFHLLRNMIQMAKMESQREQAQLNRKVLDETLLEIMETDFSDPLTPLASSLPHPPNTQSPQLWTFGGVAAKGKLSVIMSFSLL